MNQPLHNAARELESDEWTAHLNHCMACPNCSAQHDKYCFEGRELWVQLKVSEMKGLDEKAMRAEGAVLRQSSPKWAGVVSQRLSEFLKQRVGENKNG